MNESYVETLIFWFNKLSKIFAISWLIEDVVPFEFNTILFPILVADVALNPEITNELVSLFDNEITLVLNEICTSEISPFKASDNEIDFGKVIVKSLRISFVV